jgi:hypothetical protein
MEELAQLKILMRIEFLTQSQVEFTLQMKVLTYTIKIIVSTITAHMNILLLKASRIKMQLTKEPININSSHMKIRRLKQSRGIF